MLSDPKMGHLQSDAPEQTNKQTNNNNKNNNNNNKSWYPFNHRMLADRTVFLKQFGCCSIGGNGLIMETF